MASEDWISAAEALRQVCAVMTGYQARRAICSRAFVGLIDARAVRFMSSRQSGDDMKIPREFWWARGESALTQNWATGDFETWIDNTIHLRAFGVFFAREGIDALAPAVSLKSPSTNLTMNPGGRPSAAWWDDLWIEICRRLWEGELDPKKQSDIEAAMMDWAAAQGHNPAESTIRGRARKLWRALHSEGKN